LDPLKDTEADAEAIAAGLKSRRQALAERGLNIEVVDAEIAADKAREKGLGINFDTAVAAAVKVPTVAR
jgi:capsid protein